MATKIIQDTVIPRLAPAAGIAATTVPISLRSGYLRVTIGSTTGSSGGYVSIGTNPVVTQDSYHITSYSVDILKESMKRQHITGITTGQRTTVYFGQNLGNFFEPTDYVTIEGAATTGINTTHNSIYSLDYQSVTLNFDSRAFAAPDISGATLCRSVKIACLTMEPDTFFNFAEVVTLVSE
jgi:hypothetical protein